MHCIERCVCRLLDAEHDNDDKGGISTCFPCND